MGKTELIKTTELKPGDIFSFRTIKQPIYWRFIEYRNDKLIYEGIKNNTYQFSATIYLYNGLLKKILNPRNNNK